MTETFVSKEREGSHRNEQKSGFTTAKKSSRIKETIEVEIQNCALTPAIVFMLQYLETLRANRTK